MAKITKRIAEASQPRDKYFIINDGQLPGFGLQVLPSGKKSFVVQYRYGNRTRRVTIGQYGILTPEQARTIAIQMLADVRKGKDPAAERISKRNELTVKDLAELFDKKHISIRLKDSTASEYRRNLKRFILPAIGHLKIKEVARADIAKLHQKLSHIPYQANRNLEVISKMFSLAELWGLRPDATNPRRHIQKYKEKKRERYLNPDEYSALGAAITEAHTFELADQYGLTAIQLLLHTGCRLGEILNLKWSEVDLSSQTLRLADSKTGARTIFLSPKAIKTLSDLPKQEGNPYVICGKIPGKPRTDIQRFWRRLRERATVHYWKSQSTEAAETIDPLRAKYGFYPGYNDCSIALNDAGLEMPTGLLDVRIHDLRHSFASSAVSQGLSLPIIGKLLGHTQVQTTARYAHLMDEPLRKAVANIGKELEGFNI